MLSATNSSGPSYISSQEGECNVFELSFPVEVIKILIVSILSLSGLIGDTFIILMVYERKELRKTTNFFIVNMAVSDLFYPLTGITATLSSTSLVRSSRLVIASTTELISCHLDSFFQGGSLTVSIESLVCISIDRFVAVVFPLKAHLITARVRTVAIAFTWFIAVFLNSVEFYMPVCAYKNTSTFYVNFARGRTTFLFTVPLIILAISYCAIAITLRKHDRAFQCGNQSNQRKRQAIKMSFCVMLSFYFLILPLTIVANLLPDPKVFKSCSVLQNIWLLQLALYASSTVNPIICIAFVQSFRRGLTDILPCYYSKNLKVGERRKSNQKEIRLERFWIIPALDRRETLVIKTNTKIRNNNDV